MWSISKHPVETEIEEASGLLEATVLSAEFAEAFDVNRFSVKLEKLPAAKDFAAPGPSDDRYAAAREGLASIAKEAASGTVKDLIGAHLGELAKGIAIEATKQATGIALGPILQLILCATESIASRITALQAEIHQIHRRLENENMVPLAAGLEEASQALRLLASNEDALLFRSTRLHSALDKLNEAFIRAQSIGEPVGSQVRIITRFVQGLCAAGIPGGVESASAFFDDSLERIRHQSARLRDVCSEDARAIDLVRAEGFDAVGNPLRDERPTWEEKVITHSPSAWERVRLDAFTEFKMVRRYGSTRAERIVQYESRITRCQLTAERREVLCANVGSLLLAANPYKAEAL